MKKPRHKPGDYRTIAVPTWVYEKAKAAQQLLVRRGLDAVPPELLDACGHVEETLGLGIVIGLGLAALKREMETTVIRVENGAAR